MGNGMGMGPWKTVGLILLGGLLITVALIPDPDLRNLSTWSNDELIVALENDRPVLRRAAANQLVARAKTVVPTLEASAPRVTEVQRQGILDVLEQIMLATNEIDAESAESSLERLSRHPDAATADAALRVLFSNSTLRHARAYTRFVAYGGSFGKSNSSRWSYPLPNVIVPNGDTGNRILLIGKNWSGGAAGLNVLLRMYPSEQFSVHIEDAAPVKLSDFRTVQRWRPGVQLRQESESCLGVIVESRDDTRPVLISGVVPHSPADRAGLRRGDLLTHFGSHPVKNFHDLRDRSRKTHPGSRVELRLKRLDTELRIKLALGSDFLTGDCYCLDESPPEGQTPPSIDIEESMDAGISAIDPYNSSEE